MDESSVCPGACGTYPSLWQHIIFIICVTHLPERAHLPFLGPHTGICTLVSTWLVFGFPWYKMWRYLFQNISSLRFLVLYSSLCTVYASPSISPHIRVTHPPRVPSVSTPYALLLQKNRLSIVSMLSPSKSLFLVSRERQT